MGTNDDFDDVAFLALATDPDSPVDIPTAWAGAVRDEPQPARLNAAGVIAALIVTMVLAYVLW